MKHGDELLIQPAELVAGGDALAKIDGFPIFTANVYPGDVARVRLVEVKKGFARAELVSIEQPSPLRRLVSCPIAVECGGCDWTALRLDAQLAAKERILRESLRRIGKLDPDSLPPISLHPSPLNYRLRSRLQSDGNSVGFYAAGSHRVVPLAAECEVVGVETARAIGSAADGSEVARLRGSGGKVAAAIDLVEQDSDLAGGTPTLPFPADREARNLGTPQPRNGLSPTSQPPNLGTEIWELEGQLITGERELSIDVDHYHFRLATGVFFQVNRHLLATMLRLVRAHAERTSDRRRAIDLYSGVGFFSAPLAEAFERVFAVEGSPLAHHYARLNAAKNVETVHAAVEGWVQRMPRAAFVFLDPPRSGARSNVIEAVSEKATEVVCFLACDPVTFARDAKRLTASGWRLAALDLLDLFPNTHHVETLARFERA